MPPAEAITIAAEGEPRKRRENQQAMELAQNQLAQERLAEPSEEEGAKPAGQRFINAGEAPLLLAFTGVVEGVQQVVDWLNLAFGAGTIINAAITAAVLFVLFIWVTGKVAKGAPKKWYKVIYLGAAGGVIPIIPGQIGAIIWLLIQDRKILGKVAGELGEKIEKQAKKVM